MDENKEIKSAIEERDNIEKSDTAKSIKQEPKKQEVKEFKELRVAPVVAELGQTYIEPEDEQDGQGEVPKNEGRSLLIAISVLILLFAAFIVGGKLYANAAGAHVLTLDDLHKENLEKEATETNYVYNGFSFVKAEGLWWTDIHARDQIIRIPLHFGPKELENVSIIGKLDKSFNKGTDVYVTIDPLVRNKYYSLGISELSFNMASGINRKPIGSCTQEDEACDNRTIVSCENSQGKPVVELALDEENKVEYKGTCIKISGNGYGIVRGVDRILYQWYGVMS